jgi:hypothetical protein
VNESPFDVVCIREGDGARRLSCEAFLALPLHERIRHILAREVEFERHGRPVDTKLALAWLRSGAAASTVRAS